MRVLVADDCPVTRTVLSKDLKTWGYEPVMASDGEEVLRLLESDDAPGIAILDWMMPHLDGPAVCRRIRQNRNGPYIYVIMLTAKHERTDLIKALDAEADDFLSKPFDTEELRQRLRAGRRIVELQHGLAAAQEGLRFQATHDPLTHVLNRGAIIDSLTRELNRASRSGANTSLIMLDMDHFKKVNDVYGHLAGDAVLCSVTDRIREGMRSYDYVGRFGGEEFLVILPDTDEPGAATVAERLRVSVARRPTDWEGHEVSVTASLGVATAGLDQPDENALIRAADRALYRAKDAGRNRVCFATAEDSVSPVELTTCRAAKNTERWSSADPAVVL